MNTVWGGECIWLKGGWGKKGTQEVMRPGWWRGEEAVPKVRRLMYIDNQGWHKEANLGLEWGLTS